MPKIRRAKLLREVDDEKRGIYIFDFAAAGLDDGSVAAGYSFVRYVVGRIGLCSSVLGTDYLCVR